MASGVLACVLLATAGLAAAQVRPASLWGRLYTSADFADKKMLRLAATE